MKFELELDDVEEQIVAESLRWMYEAVQKDVWAKPKEKRKDMKAIKRVHNMYVTKEDKI